MRGIWALAYWIGAAVGQAAAPCARTMVRVGVVGDPAVDSLAARWSDLDSMEHAFCLVTGQAFPYPDTTRADSIYRVFAVLPAAVQYSDARNVQYICQRGTVGLHTHPLLAGVATCTPSRIDWESLGRAQATVGVIQCGPRQFVWYFAADYRR